MPFTESELSRVIGDIRKPFIQTRDRLWDARRKVRHRLSEPWLPQGLDQYAGMIRYRDSSPGFYIEGLKQRLGVNALNLEVKGDGEHGKRDETRLSKVEAWFYGVLAALDSTGQIDHDLRDGQAADGISFAELEFLPRFTPDPNDSRTLEQQRKYAPIPYRLGAPDPLGLAWSPFDVSRGLKIMVKTMNVPLVEVQDNWRAEDIRLTYKGDMSDPRGRLSVEKYIYGGEQAPGPGALDIGRIVRVMVIAEPNWIYHCVSPIASAGGTGFMDEEPALILLAKYPNPINEVPFYACWGRKTREADPGLMYQPLALEQLDQAPYQNQMMTIRMMRGVLEATRPDIIENTTDQDVNEAPIAHRPGYLVLRSGLRLGTYPTNSVPDLDKIINDLKENTRNFELNLMHNQQVGASTPAWGTAQLQEEISSFLKGAVDSRANCWRDILNAVAKCTYNKHARDGELYVRTQSRSRKRPERGAVDMYIGINSEDLEPSSYRLEVSIDAKTAAERMAATEYGRRLRDEGTLSQETYETDFTPIEDRVMEQRRKDIEQLERGIVDPILGAREHVRETARPALGNLVDILFGPSPLTPAPAPAPPAGIPDPSQPLPGDGEPVGYPVSPGLGMSLELPEPPSVRNPSVV